MISWTRLSEWWEGWEPRFLPAQGSLPGQDFLLVQASNDLRAFSVIVPKAGLFDHQKPRPAACHRATMLRGWLNSIFLGWTWDSRTDIWICQFTTVCALCRTMLGGDDGHPPREGHLQLFAVQAKIWSYLRRTSQAGVRAVRHLQDDGWRGMTGSSGGLWTWILRWTDWPIITGRHLWLPLHYDPTEGRDAGGKREPRTRRALLFEVTRPHRHMRGPRVWIWSKGGFTAIQDYLPRSRHGMGGEDQELPWEFHGGIYRLEWGDGARNRCMYILT